MTISHINYYINNIVGKKTKCHDNMSENVKTLIEIRNYATWWAKT